MIIPLTPSPALQGSGGSPRDAFSDADLVKAWNRHVECRKAQLDLDLLAASISETTYEARVAVLDRDPPEWGLMRGLLAAARLERAPTDPLVWHDNFSQALMFLKPARMPENMPRRASRPLIEFPEGSAPVLADDAVVLAHLEQSPYEDLQSHVFWIQWMDEWGNDVGYRLTLTDYGEGSSVFDPPEPDIEVERLHLAT